MVIFKKNHHLQLFDFMVDFFINFTYIVLYNLGFIIKILLISNFNLITR